MSRPFDAIIFGATGFTGKFVLENAADVLKDYKWAIAGRDEHRMRVLLKQCSAERGMNFGEVPIVLADINDEQSIAAMARQCKVVLNCVGPYMLYGERVVRACVETGTHHVDLSGEPQYIEGMHMKYNEQASMNGAYIISACAYESVPADMGVIHAAEQFEGTINSVEAYLENTVRYQDKSSRALLHRGTYDSFLEVLRNIGQLLRLQDHIRERTFCSLQPKLRVKLWPQKPSQLDSYFLPFPADRAIVQHTQHRLWQVENKRPIQFESYGGFRSLLTTILVPVYLLLGLLLAQFSWTFRLLQRFPNIFSLGIMTSAGPLQQNMDSHYFSFTFKATGWAKNEPLTTEPRRVQWTRVSGYNPYYGTTSVILLTAAKVLLSESARMPGTGGVLPPGYAFANTTFIQQLSQASKYPLKFQLLHWS